MLYRKVSQWGESDGHASRFPRFGVVFGVARWCWLSLALAASVAGVVARFNPSNETNFGLFEASARAWLRGADPYAVLRPVGNGTLVPNLNPPLWLPLFGAFTVFPTDVAAHVWLALSAVGFGGVLFLCAGSAGAWRSWRGYALLAGPVIWETFAQQQIYAVPLLALAAGWRASRANHRYLAAVLFGLAVALKPPLAVVVIAVYVVDRRLAVAIAAAAALWSLLPVPVVGLAAYRGWLHASSLAPFAAWENASLYAVAGRVAGPAVAWGVTVLIVGLVALRGRRAGEREGALELGICGALAASPITWPQYFGLLWPAYLGREDRRPSPVFDAALLIAATPEWLFTASGLRVPLYALALAGFCWEALRPLPLRQQRVASVGDDCLAGDPAGFGSAEEGDDGGDVLRKAEATEGGALTHLEHVALVGKRPESVGLHDPA